MSDLESALRAALGMPEPEPQTTETAQTDPPLALNDDNALTALIYSELEK